MKNRTVLSSVPWGAAALAAIAQAFACFEQPAATPVLSGEGGGTAEGGQAAETQLTAVNVEPEVQEAFNNAACFCEAYLINPTTASGDTTPEWVSQTISADACTGDPRLADYAKISLSDRQKGQCATATTPSPPKLRTITEAEKPQERLHNGCWDPISLDGSTGQAPSPGFCRADFNYCIGQQLRLKADSLARPPSNAESRAKILEEARHRFEMAGAEFAETLNRLDDACTPEGGCFEDVEKKTGTFVEFIEVTKTCEEDCDADGGNCHEVCTILPRPQAIPGMCNGFATEKRNALLAQTPDPYDNFVSASGALTPTTGGQLCTVTYTYPSFRRDPRANEAYGNTATERLADSISQAADLADAEVRERMAVSDALSVVGPSFPADLWGPSGQRALAARSLFGDRTPRPGSQQPPPRRLQRDDGPRRALDLLEAYHVPFPYQICPSPGAWEPLDEAGANAWAAGAHAALLAILSEQLQRPPQETPGGPDLLRLEHAVGLEHIRPALDLLRDRVDQLALDYSFAPADGAPPGSCGRGVLRLNARTLPQREPAALAASFADGVSAGAIECSLDGPRPSTKALAAMGAAGALDFIRAKAHTLSRRTRLKPWGEFEGVKSALNQAKSLVGTSFTEWSHCDQGACGTTVYWSLSGDVDNEPTKVVVARSEDELSCLRHGHMPGALAGTGCPAVPEFTLAVTTGADGIKRRTFSMPDGPFATNDRAFIVSKPADPASRSHRLLDVIYPKASKGRHAFGGKLLDDVSRLEAHDPANPAQAAFNSLGIANDFVPPLDNALNQGAFQAEAHIVYLNRAREKVNALKAELTLARDIELDFLKFSKEVELADDLAEIAQQETVTAACGQNTSGCAVGRRNTPTTLAELGLVPEAGVEPDGYPGIQTCTQFLATPSFVLPHDGTKEYVDGFLKAALQCAGWAVLNRASKVKFERMPLPVYQKITNNTPITVGGETGNLLIELHAKLEEIRTKLREFKTIAAIAEQNRLIAVSTIDDLEPTWWQGFTCTMGRVTQVAVGVGTFVASMGANVGVDASLTSIGGPGIQTGAGGLGGAIGAAASINDCFDNSAAQNAAREAWTRAFTSIQAMYGLADESVRLVNDLAIINNKLDQIQSKVTIAAQRRELERRIALNKVQFDPAWRALQGKRVETVRHNLFEAQKAAFNARRSLEFRTATELRWLDDYTYSTPGTPKTPAAWSNNLFTVNQSYLGTNYDAGPVNVAGERIDDYVKSLEAFVDEYAEKYGFQLDNGTTILHLSSILGIGANEPLANMLLFKCKNNPALLLGGRLPGAESSTPPCAGALGGVVSAETTFTIPSTLSGYYAGKFIPGQKNYRLQSVAVNLVSPLFIDCDLATLPQDCYTDNTLSYELRQNGLVGLENLNDEHRYYDMGAGLINAQGLAAELLLELPLVGEDLVINTFLKDNLRGRPLASMYTLRLPVVGASSQPRPELVWQNLDDVQILVNYEYWTPLPAALSASSD